VLYSTALRGLPGTFPSGKRDDLASRKCAAALRIPARGTLAVLLLAKKQGRLVDVDAVLAQIQQADLHIATGILEDLRRMARRSAAYRLFLSRLRQARIEVGLTQVEVAKRLRRPQSYVSKCESGERRVDVVELTEFARLYGKALDFFVS